MRSTRDAADKIKGEVAMLRNAMASHLTDTEKTWEGLQAQYEEMQR